MTAQQQLATLTLLAEGPSIPLAEVPQFVQFFTDHGQAIAELIEAARLVHEFPTGGRLNHLGKLVQKLTEQPK